MGSYATSMGLGGQHGPRKQSTLSRVVGWAPGTSLCIVGVLSLEAGQYCYCVIVKTSNTRRFVSFRRSARSTANHLGNLMKIHDSNILWRLDRLSWRYLLLVLGECHLCSSLALSRKVLVALFFVLCIEVHLMTVGLHHHHYIPLATKPDGRPVWSSVQNDHFVGKVWV